MAEDQDVSRPSIQDLVAELPQGDARLRLEVQCREAGVPFEWDAWMGRDDINLSADISIPNGKGRRFFSADAHQAERLLRVDIGKIKALGDLDAYFYEDSNTIEVRIAPHDARSRPLRLERLPGVQQLAASVPDSDGPSPEEGHSPSSDGELGESRSSAGWILPILGESNTGLAAEFGSPSDRYAALAGMEPPWSSSVTVLRIRSLRTDRHDELLQTLQILSDTLFFNMELKYGIAARLMKVSRPFGFGRTERFDHSVGVPSMPRTAFQSKPLSLYWYGRSAARMPLLQFLAYYQVLEYYFPKYAQRELVDRLRNKLRDPLFDIEEDGNLVRIIKMASQASGGTGRERDQLKATLRACVDVDHLKEFLSAAPHAKFYAGTKVIRDVASIELDSKKADLRDQVASRIYDLRCRIVHTKDDGGEKMAELLLPFSDEADRLGHDIELVRFLAQRVLIAGASKLHI